MFGRSGKAGVAGTKRQIATGISVVALLACSAPALAANCKDMPAPSVDWQDCNKINIILEGSELDNANLAGTDFTYTDLRSSSLNGANFEKATMIRSSLAGSKAEKANFTRIEGYRTVFSQVVGGRARLRQRRIAARRFHRGRSHRGRLPEGRAWPRQFLRRDDHRREIPDGQSFARGVQGRELRRTARLHRRISCSSPASRASTSARRPALIRCRSTRPAATQSTKLPSGLKAPADWPCSSRIRAYAQLREASARSCLNRQSTLPAARRL